MIGPEPAPDPPPVLGDPPPGDDYTFRCFGGYDDGDCVGGSGPAVGSPNNFGGKFVWRYDQNDVRGVRAGIRTPRTHDFWLPYVTAGVMRVSAEAQRTLIQTGFGRTVRISVEVCGRSPEEGPDGPLYTYYESKAVILGEPITECRWLDKTKRGKSKLYTVYRKVRAPNTTTWQVNIDGRERHIRNMGVDGMKLALAGGEIVGNSPIFQFTFPDGKLFGCYGCTATRKGVIPWQRTTNPGSVGWFNISTGAFNITDPNKTDGRWVVSAIPSGGGKFTVLHDCWEDHRLGC